MIDRKKGNRDDALLPNLTNWVYQGLCLLTEGTLIKYTSLKAQYTRDHTSYRRISFVQNRLLKKKYKKLQKHTQTCTNEEIFILNKYLYQALHSVWMTGSVYRSNFNTPTCTIPVSLVTSTLWWPVSAIANVLPSQLTQTYNMEIYKVQLCNWVMKGHKIFTVV